MSAAIICAAVLSVASGQNAAPPGADATPRAALLGEGLISTVDNETGAAYAPDGRTLYFAVQDRANLSFSAILYAELRGGRWTAPRVAPFSGLHADSHPFVTPDGRRLFFSSQRREGGGAKRDFDIWFVERQSSGAWGEPRRVGGPVNTDANELSPAVTRDGALYFWSTRPGGRGGADIYRARPAAGDRYAEPENLGEAVNTPANEADLYVAPDESLIVFMSDRPGGVGRGDLWVSRRAGVGAWEAPRNLGPAVNSPATEAAPHLSPDGRRLIFVSNRGPGDDLERRVTYRELRRMLRSTLNNFGNIYEADARALGP